jgi:hypothetical protein
LYPRCPVWASNAVAAANPKIPAHAPFTKRFAARKPRAEFLACNCILIVLFFICVFARPCRHARSFPWTLIIWFAAFFAAHSYMGEKKQKRLKLFSVILDPLENHPGRRPG